MLISHLSSVWGPLLILWALLIAVVVEVVVALLFGYRNKRGITTVVLINLFTNPIVNYLVVRSIYFGRAQISGATIVGVEVAVVLAEWFLLWFVLQKDPKKLFWLSVIMNLASYLVGWIVFSIVRF